MYYCYLLFSQTLNRFYTGSTTLDPNDRLENHLEKYYGKTKFTAKAKDWELFYFIKCETKNQACGIERHIKRMKSQTYNRNLKKFPEITLKLLAKYK